MSHKNEMTILLCQDIRAGADLSRQVMIKSEPGGISKSPARLTIYACSLISPLDDIDGIWM